MDTGASGRQNAPMQGRGPTYAAYFLAGTLVLTALSTQLFPPEKGAAASTAVRWAITVGSLPLALAAGWFFGRYLDRRDGR